MMTEMVKDTISKDKWWIYLIFFLIGIFFFLFLIVLKGFIVLPLLICSILFALALYKFKMQSVDFALRAFAISFVTSYLIFFIGYFGGHFIDVWFPLLFYLLLFLVIFAITRVAFKEQPLHSFTLKAFVVSFGTFFIIFGAMFITNDLQNDAITSTSINIESSAENLTIYIPVLLDENKTVLKMYENPEITGNVTTAVIDTEYGKALMISGSGLGDYLFNWNEVPGKDTDRFVGWLESRGSAAPWKPGISKSDDGRAITLSGIMYNAIYQLNEEGVMKHYRVDNNEMSEVSDKLFFAKEENDQLNIYSGIIKINMNENHEILKEDTQSPDEFLKGFTISMSDYTSSEFFLQQSHSELYTFDAWVYSDSEVENVRFSFDLNPENRIDRRDISIGTGWRGVDLRKGWQVVNLSGEIWYGH